MTPQTFALLERLHGHLAVLGLVLLLHPIVSLWRRPGLPLWTRRTAELGALLLAVPFAMGWWIYGTYRRSVKPGLFADEHPALLWFETKEHLAAFATALAIGAAIALRAAGTRPEVRRAAWWMLVAAWCCGVAAGGLGIVVSSITAPGW